MSELNEFLQKSPVAERIKLESLVVLHRTKLSPKGILALGQEGRYSPGIKPEQTAELQVGESVVASRIVRWSVRLLMFVAVLAAAGHLGWQAYLASFVEYEEHDNPYVYAHSTSDMPRLAERIREIVAAVPVGTAGYVEVVCIDGDFWPLPWYMRDFRRVGWFDGVPVKTPAPLVAVIDPKFEPALLKKVFELLPPDERHLYVALLKEQNGRNDWRIRPPVSLRAYVRQDLWDAYAAQQAEQVLPGGE